MVTPLHIEIAMHYFCRVGEFDSIENPTPHQYADELVNGGVLRRGGLGERVYEATDGLKVWLDGVCSVPFPIQQWVIPQK